MNDRVQVKALAIIVRPQDGALLAQCYHEPDRKPYYRPCGGKVEFGELSADTVRREIQEELGLSVVPERLLGVVEVHFGSGENRAHQITFCWLCRFEDENAYQLESLLVNETDQVYEAHWVQPAQLQAQGTALYPDELVGLLESMK